MGQRITVSRQRDAEVPSAILQEEERDVSMVSQQPVTTSPVVYEGSESPGARQDVTAQGCYRANCSGNHGYAHAGHQGVSLELPAVAM